MNPEEIVQGAFAGVLGLRHVSVESGIRLIGAEAWQNCRQLRTVKLPATVVGISDNVFRNCKLPNSVLAPGCRNFGYKVFAECCSLQWVHMFNSEAKIWAIPLSVRIYIVEERRLLETAKKAIESFGLFE